MHKLLFLLWFPQTDATGTNNGKHGWILNSPKYYCNEDCKRNLYTDSLKFNTSGCLENDVLALNTSQTQEIAKCLRVKNGLKQLTTTGIPRNDYRFTCRPSKDRMTWYRGWQSLTFSGKPCMRWDEAPTKFPLKSFSNFSSPSVDYMTQMVFSTTISQHENYCRNPDNHPLGPWCFYKDEDKIRRAPCFYTCVTDIRQLCLAKAFFPYYQTPYPFDSAPLSPVDPRVLRTIKDSRLKERNARLDLSDILDVPDVVGAVEHATPLYSIALTTRHLTQARLAGNAVVTRKKCHQTGIRTLIAGPWTPIRDDSLFLPEDGDPEQVGPILRDFLRSHMLAGRQGIDKPWRPCFSACEDNTYTCWPISTTNQLNRRLFYFGNKVVDGKQRSCLKWTEAMSVLYRYYSSYIKQVKKKSAVKRKELKKINPDLALQIYYYEELNRRVDGQNRPIVNRFRDGGGRLMHREICLDLARLIEHDSERSNPIWGSDFLLDIAHRTLFSQGPGCFAWMSANKTFVKFEPCFDPCKCKSETMHEPFQSYREMCGKENHDYEPCTASRDVRTLNIRYYDEKLKAIPEAYILGIFTPLITTVISGTMCLLITWFGQIMDLLFPRR